MPAVSRSVVARFPEHELAIERLFRRSEAFRSMCEDYALGLEALRRWQFDAASKRGTAIVELRHSLEELEAEILSALHEEGATGRCG
jgi:hypothetical protein